jgi:hypothetical protein
LVFHLNAGGYYALLLRGFGPGDDLAFKLVKHVFWERRQHDLSPWTLISSGISGPAGRPQHKITVESNKGLIRVSVDLQQLGEFRDRSFPNGLVGFAVFGNTRAVFRDLVVESIR